MKYLPEAIAIIDFDSVAVRKNGSKFAALGFATNRFQQETINWIFLQNHWVVKNQSSQCLSHAECSQLDFLQAGSVWKELKSTSRRINSERIDLIVPYHWLLWGNISLLLLNHRWNSNKNVRLINVQWIHCLNKSLYGNRFVYFLHSPTLLPCCWFDVIICCCPDWLMKTTFWFKMVLFGPGDWTMNCCVPCY